MTLLARIKAMFGLHIGLSNRVREHVYHQFRGAVHANRNELTRSIGVSHASQRLSGQALLSLQETIRQQEEVGVSVDRNFLDRARGMRR